MSKHAIKQEVVRAALARKHSRRVTATEDGTLPPRPWLCCPQCDGEALQAKRWNAEDDECYGPQGWVWYDGDRVTCPEWDCEAELKVVADWDHAYLRELDFSYLAAEDV